MPTLHESLRFILASQSPRRRDLLTVFGLPFEVQAANIDESQHPNEAPRDYVRRMSIEKAQAIQAEGYILAADTVVVHEQRVLGKPQDATEARDTLKRLRDDVHHVMTAATLLQRPTGRMWTTVARSPVHMRPYTNAEIEAYIATGDPFDKAGGYAIQHEGFSPAKAFEHCFANVMGLPLCHVRHLFVQASIPIQHDIPHACQAHLAYTCPVYEQFIGGAL